MLLTTPNRGCAPHRPSAVATSRCGAPADCSASLTQLAHSLLSKMAHARMRRAALRMRASPQGVISVYDLQTLKRRKVLQAAEVGSQVSHEGG
jgi:hypothetical protein